MKLLPESKFRLEMCSVSQIKRYGVDKENFMVDRDALLVTLNKDCPATHFIIALEYKAW